MILDSNSVHALPARIYIRYHIVHKPVYLYEFYRVGSLAEVGWTMSATINPPCPPVYLSALTGDKKSDPTICDIKKSLF